MCLYTGFVEGLHQKMAHVLDIGRAQFHLLGLGAVVPCSSETGLSLLIHGQVTTTRYRFSFNSHTFDQNPLHPYDLYVHISNERVW